MSSLPDDQTVKDHIARLRIKELSECLDRLGMKKQGRKEDLQRRLLTVIDDAGSLWSAGLQTHGMPQVEATKRVVEEVYARYMVEKTRPLPPALRIPPSHSEATSAPSASANGGTSATSSRLPHSHSNPSGVPARWPTSNAGPRPYHPNALGFLPAQPSNSHTNSVAGPSSGSRSCTPQAHASTSAGVHAAAAVVAPGGVVRCICEQPAARSGELLTCSNCHVYQHARCVTKPETRASAPPHMCERCRAERIDPFWEVVTSDIMPAFKLLPTGRNTYVGTKLEPVQNAERSFTITPPQYELFKKRPNHKLQVICMQLGDSVPYRCLWPLASELRVNGLQLHVYNRGAHTKPGKNLRDEPANIGVLANPSRNRITMSCSDPASYVLLLQIVRRRSTEEVKGLTKPPLPLPQAIERVKREIKSSDEDIEVDHAVVSLKCPLTGARVKTPARFSEIEGLMFFDLDAFLSVAERSRKWQCPNSMRNSSVFTLQVDAFMSSIVGSLRDLPDVAEVQVSPQGQWRPVGGPGVKGTNSSWPWCDAGVAPSALRLPEGQTSSAAQPQQSAIKQEAGASSRPSGEDSSDEEDEDAELRKAAQAMHAQQRKAKQAASELIVISDSSEDEAPRPPPKRPRPAVSPSSSTVPQPPRSIPPPGHIRVRVKPPAYMLACPPPPSSATPAQPPLPPNPPPPLPTHPHPGSSGASQAAYSHPHHRPSPPTPMELVHAAAVPLPPAPSSSGTIAHARAPALPAAQGLVPAPPLPANPAASSAGAAAAAHAAPLPPTSLPGMPMMSMPLMSNGPSQVSYQGGWQGNMNGNISSSSAGRDCGGVGGGSSSVVPPFMASPEHIQLAALEQMQQQLQQQLQQQQRLQGPLQQPSQAILSLQMQLLQVQQQLHRMQQLLQQQSQQQSQSQSQPLPFSSSPLAFQSYAMSGLQLPLYPLQLDSQPHPAHPGLHNHLPPATSQPALPSSSSSLLHHPQPLHVPEKASHAPVLASQGLPAAVAGPVGGWGGFRPASTHPLLHIPQPPSPPSPPALVQPPSSSPSPRAQSASQQLQLQQQQQQQASRRQAVPQSEVIVIDDDSD